MKRLKTEKDKLFFILLLAAGVLLVYILYPKVYPAAGMDRSLSIDSVKSRSIEVLERLNLPADHLMPVVSFNERTNLLLQTQNRFGLGETNELTRDYLPTYYWYVSFVDTTNKDSLEILISPGKEVMIEGGLRFELSFSMRGDLLFFETQLPEKFVPSQLDSSGLEKLYAKFKEGIKPFNPYVEFKEVDSTGLRKKHSGEGADYTVYNYYLDAEHDIYIEEYTGISRQMVTDYKLTYFHKDAETPSDSKLIRITALIALIVFLVVTFIVIGIKKFRSYEMGFKQGIVFGLLAFISFGVFMATLEMKNYGPEQILGSLVSSFFLGAVLILIWSVSESVGREFDNGKFIQLDLISRGHFLNSNVGAAIIRGLGTGTFLFGAWLLLTYILSVSGLVFGVLPDNQLELLKTRIPVATISGYSVFNTLYTTVLFFIFTYPLMRSWINSKTAAIIIMGLIYGLGMYTDIEPEYSGVLIDSVVGVGLFIMFARYDILSVIFALLTYHIFEKGYALLLMNNSAMQGEGIILFSLGGILLLIGLISIATKDRRVNLKMISPDFTRFITERQRLQNEFEVAHSVQMSFLPKENPVCCNLDIAAGCIPALEIGGDYYDFVQLSDTEIGVVIGDVSGKGTKAAFYMTLTKGFLQTLARLHKSPSKIMSGLNSLFYQNVERGAFISMVYGFFDMNKRSLTFARAGHNPLMIKHAGSDEVTVYNAPGMALGLDKGTRFDEYIEDKTINIKNGDIIVFYTDGFTEARNKKNEEFGEERFTDLIKKFSGLSAEEMKDNINKELRRFIGKATQHDDMSIVIMKVDESFYPEA